MTQCPSRNHDERMATEGGCAICSKVATNTERHRGTPASSQIIWLEKRVKELEERAATLEACGHKTALDLECLLIDTKDLPTVSRWWDSGMASIEAWRKLFEYNGPRLGM